MKVFIHISKSCGLITFSIQQNDIRTTIVTCVISNPKVSASHRSSKLYLPKV